MDRKLLFIVNVDFAFLSHRLPIAIKAQSQGYEVHVATLITNRLTDLESHGFHVHPLPMRRGMVGLVSELRTLLEIIKIFRLVKPDLVHLVTAKSVIFGGIAARLMSTHGVVAAVPGLGSIFLENGSKATVLRNIITILYRIALGKKNLKVIFQNPDDRDAVVEIAKLSENQIEMIRGSGTDLSRYSYTLPPTGIPVIALASRILGDKGVREYCEAARIIKERGINARFLLAGSTDPSNPTSIPESELKTYEQDGLIELVGHTEDIPSLFKSCNIVVLPSYREGLPKVLIEAAACGRAVITTDVPGCRDAIEEGVTGILVPVKDKTSLADALQELILNPEKCRQMGAAGRELAEREYDINKVVDTHLRIYEKLFSNSETTTSFDLKNT